MSHLAWYTAQILDGHSEDDYNRMLPKSCQELFSASRLQQVITNDYLVGCSSHSCQCSANILIIFNPIQYNRRTTRPPYEQLLSRVPRSYLQVETEPNVGFIGARRPPYVKTTWQCDHFRSGPILMYRTVRRLLESNESTQRATLAPDGAIKNSYKMNDSAPITLHRRNIPSAQGIHWLLGIHNRNL